MNRNVTDTSETGGNDTTTWIAIVTMIDSVDPGTTLTLVIAIRNLRLARRERRKNVLIRENESFCASRLPDICWTVDDYKKWS